MAETSESEKAIDLRISGLPRARTYRFGRSVVIKLKSSKHPANDAAPTSSSSAVNPRKRVKSKANTSAIALTDHIVLEHIAYVEPLRVFSPQPGIMMDDRVKDRLVDASRILLDLSAADSDRFGVVERLLRQLGGLR
ncbi:hypothetical protein [Mesorhizobium loti]|uniref:hypothetical protein n=1 Tax=Rhizobium loti TaxID=381 RepID=UPI00053A9582